MHIKDFNSWHILKKSIQTRNRPLIFKEREIWWCSIGCNIGDEQDGKNELFNRPILIIRKFNRNLFYGLPLSSKIKNNPYYHAITFKERNISALLSQMRILDKKRLQRRIGVLDEHDFDNVRKAFTALF